MTDKPKRRWYQFRLRSLFVLTALVAVGCSVYSCYYAQARIEGDVGFRICACGLTNARI